MSDLISRADAIEMAVDVETPQGTYERAIYVDDLMALPSAESVKVAYICDGRKCDKDCSECFRTLDIEHARDFKLMGDTYYQQESADAVDVAHDIPEYCSWSQTYTNMVQSAMFSSADAVQGYTEWLEKIIVDNEGANEWLCEDTPDLEWCENNCHYSSIQAECLRHLYEVSKGGDSE